MGTVRKLQQSIGMAVMLPQSYSNGVTVVRRHSPVYLQESPLLEIQC